MKTGGVLLFVLTMNSSLFPQESSKPLITAQKGHTDRIVAVAFSPDGRNAITADSRIGSPMIKVWDLLTGRELRDLRGHRFEADFVTFSPNGKYVLTWSTLEKKLTLWNASDGREFRTLTFEHPGMSFPWASVSTDGLSVALLKDRTLELWNTATGTRTRVIERMELELFHSAGNDLVVGADPQSARCVLYDATGNVRTSFPRLGLFNHTAFSSDGRVGVFGNETGRTIEFWDLLAGSRLRALTLAGDVKRVDVSRDGTFAGALAQVKGETPPKADGSADYYVYTVWETTGGGPVGSLPLKELGAYLPVALSPDGRRLLSGHVDGSVVLWDVASGTSSRLGVRPADHPFIGFSAKGRYLFASCVDAALKKNDNVAAVLWDLSSGACASLLLKGDRVDSLRFSRQDTLYLLSARSRDRSRLAKVNPVGSDNTLRLYDRDNKEIVNLVLFTDGEWIVITPDGYFNASPGGAKHLTVHVGSEVLSMDNFFETFFRPDVVSARIAGLPAPSTGLSPLTAAMRPPPQITMLARSRDGGFQEIDAMRSGDLQTRDGTIEVKLVARSAGGGVLGVRLYNNGKAVGENLRGFKAVNSSASVEQMFVVPLSSGENLLRAVGIADDRTESNPTTAIVRFAGEGPVRPDLYLLAIGINEYRNARYNLDFCVRDARSFTEVLSRSAGRLFQHVYPLVLADREATRANVLNALGDISRKIRPEDVFVLFYAGHGIALDLPDEVSKSRSEFFYVLSDVTQMTDPARAAKDGLSGNELKAQMTALQALKQVMFVDACNSGALVAQFAVRGAAEENALAKLSRATGSVIYASTTKEQFASELKELSHGAFTYVLLNALNGDASLPNGQITVASLKAYVDDRIPELTKKYKGEEQFPTTFIWGQDFPIGIK
jgi:WD40 repeat protein